jgi:hypothetical protein
MHPDDAATLFERVAVGTTGVLIYQPVVIAIVMDRVWIEAHPDPYRRAPNALVHVKEYADRNGIADRIDWTKVAQVLKVRAGHPEDVTASQTTR